MRRLHFPTTVCPRMTVHDRLKLASHHFIILLTWHPLSVSIGGGLVHGRLRINRETHLSLFVCLSLSLSLSPSPLCLIGEKGKHFISDTQAYILIYKTDNANKCTLICGLPKDTNSWLKP